MIDPNTWSLALSLSDVINGLLGNELSHLFHKIFPAAYRQFRRVVDNDTIVNHDIARTVRHAQLTALQRVLESYVAANASAWTSTGVEPYDFLRSASKYCREELIKIDVESDVIRSSSFEELEASIDGLLAPQPGPTPSGEQAAAIAEFAKQAVLDELHSSLDGVAFPEDFVSFFNKGQQNPDYAGFLREFSDQINESLKTDTRFCRIMLASGLAAIKMQGIEIIEIELRIERQLGVNHTEVVSLLDRINEQIQNLDGLTRTDFDETNPQVTALYYELIPPLGADHSDEVHRRITAQINGFARPDQEIHGDVTYYIIESSMSDDTVVRLASWASSLTDDFRNFIDDVVTSERLCDIRIVVAAGEVSKLSFYGAAPRDTDGHRGVRYWGQLLDDAQVLLHGSQPGEVTITGISEELERHLALSFRKGERDGTAFWRYHRPWRPLPDQAVPEISAETVETLSKPLLAGRKARELRHYEAPKGYGTIRGTLLKNGLVVLRGRLGVGKSLCALHLVAELTQVDRRTPRLPRGSRRLWQMLNDDDRSDSSVILFDDAFGKVVVRPKPYMDEAKEQLQKFASTDPRARSDRCVILTVRDSIWPEVMTAWKDQGLEAFLSAHLIDLDEQEDMGAVFGSLCGALLTDNSPNRGNAIPPDVSRRVAPMVREALRYPIDVRDFFEEFRKRTWLHISGNLAETRILVSEYAGDTRARYTKQLMEFLSLGSEAGWPECHNFAYLFLGYVFGNAFATQEQLRTMLFDVVTELGSSRLSSTTAELLWESCVGLNTQWGSWSAGGDFRWVHPSREEVLGGFLASPAADNSVELLFQALSKINRAKELAFAVPKVGGRLGDNRRRIIDEILGNGDGGRDSPSAFLSNAIGHALRTLSYPSLRVDEASAAYLVDKLRVLLRRRDHSAAAAVAAVCDNYREDGTELPRLTDTDLPTLIRAIATDAKSSRDVKVQIAWAIFSNFSELPALKGLAFDLASDDRDEWVRLRSLEALVDYYGEIDNAERARADSVLRQRMLHDESVVVRRGLAASLDATYDKISDDLRRCLLEMARDRTSLDVIEWVTWTCGEHFSDERKQGLLDGDGNSPLRRLTERTLSGLALHEDARVRMWVARALVEGSAAKHSDLLSDLVAKLADDPNEHVLEAAGLVFGDE